MPITIDDVRDFIRQLPDAAAVAQVQEAAAQRLRATGGPGPRARRDSPSGYPAPSRKRRATHHVRLRTGL